MFADDRRCQVVLVTLPEETPVTETVETAFSLEEDVGIKLGPVVVNARWQPIDGLAEALDTHEADARGAGIDPTGDPAARAARYRLARLDDQATEVERLAAELPLPQLQLPYLFRASLGPDDLAELAAELAGQLAPSGS